VQYPWHWVNDAAHRPSNAEVVIDQDKLGEQFEATAAKMPSHLELAGVTFHPKTTEREWVAFATSRDDPDAGCEGWGGTPLEALADLARHVREERR